MGGRGKVSERSRARELRAGGWTLESIAAAVGASKSSVSVWVRDVAFDRAPPRSRAAARHRAPNALERRKRAEIEGLLEEGLARVGQLSERDLLIAGTALYAGEGSKRDGAVHFANSDPRMVGLFCRWLRTFFAVDETRLRVRLYLHEGLDLDAATAFWSEVTGIPPTQFNAPYRAVPNAGIRHTKHVHGCVGIRYASSTTHRTVMGFVAALLRSDAFPG